MAAVNFLRINLVVNENVWECVRMCGNVWECVGMFENVWGCVGMCGNVRECVRICKHLYYANIVTLYCWIYGLKVEYTSSSFHILSLFLENIIFALTNLECLPYYESWRIKWQIIRHFLVLNSSSSGNKNSFANLFMHINFSISFILHS